MGSPYAFGDTKGVDFTNIIKTLENATQEVNKAIQKLQDPASSGVSITAMMQLQMLMNHLSQLSEMSTSVMQALQTSQMSVARGVKS